MESNLDSFLSILTALSSKNSIAHRLQGCHTFINFHLTQEVIMKKNFGLILAIALGLSALLLTIAYQAGWVKARSPLQETREGAPDFISYQGQIWDGDVPYDGDGYFMFAIINEGEDYIWSNDGFRPPETSIAPASHQWSVQCQSRGHNHTRYGRQALFSPL